MGTVKRTDTRRTYLPHESDSRHSARTADGRKVRLNEAAIKAIEPPSKGNRVHYDSDVTGFGLRVTAADARAFVLRYVIDGRERRMTIGSWPEWTATAARERAKELRRAIDAGTDPLAAKEERRAEPDWAELVKLYLKIEASTQRRGKEYGQILHRETLPVWGRVRVRDIRRRDIIALIESKAQAAPIAANRLFELVRRVFNFAIRRDIIEASPCVQVKKPGVERSKDRVLSREEIATLWAGLDGEHFSKQTAAALRLILATAQRPGEVCSMRWVDADLDGSLWTIPADTAKNALAHRVPLNATAMEILRALPRDGEHVFPTGTGVGSISPNALSQAVRKSLQKPTKAEAKKLKRAKREPLKIDRFTPHDLRRTAASMMASAGVQRFLIGRVLNHAEPGVTRVYDRHGYDAEKRTALDTWNRLLCSIVEPEATPDKVVSIGEATA